MTTNNPSPQPTAESERPPAVCRTFLCDNRALPNNSNCADHQSQPTPPTEKEARTAVQARWPKAFEHDGEIFVPDADNRKAYLVGSSWVEVLSERPSMSTENADFEAWWASWHKRFAMGELWPEDPSEPYQKTAARDAWHAAQSALLKPQGETPEGGRKSYHPSKGYMQLTDHFIAKCAELKEAYAALLSIANNTCCGGCQEARLVARKALGMEAASVTPEPAEGRPESSSRRELHAKIKRYAQENAALRAQIAASLPPSEPVSPQCPSCKQIVSFTLQHLCGDRYVCVPQGERSEFQRRRDVSEPPQPQAEHCPNPSCMHLLSSHSPLGWCAVVDCVCGHVSESPSPQPDTPTIKRFKEAYERSLSRDGVAGEVR